MLHQRYNLQIWGSDSKPTYKCYLLSINTTFSLLVAIFVLYLKFKPFIQLITGTVFVHLLGMVPVYRLYKLLRFVKTQFLPITMERFFILFLRFLVRKWDSYMIMIKGHRIPGKESKFHRVKIILQYVQSVEKGELPHNHEIMRQVIHFKSTICFSFQTDGFL